MRFAQVVSSGFSETDEGAGLERELVERLRPLGTRVIGPNCLGTHSSAARLTFIPEAPLTPGGVAVVSQSGGLSVDILRLGAARGLAFHSVTSIGNGADVTPAELLEHLLDSPETTVIGLYLESLGAARSVLDVVRRREVAKPIVLLAGGRTADGSRAATSHTGALSGNHRLWPAIARQSGITLVDSLEDFVNVLLVMDTVDLDVRPHGVDVVLFGNGGGASVLAADALERHGLRTPRLPDATVARLDDLGLPPGNGLHNPIDAPAPTLAVRGGAIAEDIITTVLEKTSPAVVITHLNVGIIQRNLGATHGDVTGAIVEAVARARVAARHACHHVLVLKTDGKPDTEEQIRGHVERARSLGPPRAVDVRGRGGRRAGAVAVSGASDPLLGAGGRSPHHSQRHREPAGGDMSSVTETDPAARHELRRAAALAMGGPRKLEKRAEAGQLNARERVDRLFDPESFRESGLFATSHLEADKDVTPADGKVTGTGDVDGRRAAVISYDFTVKGASSGQVSNKKMQHMKDLATRCGMPLVYLAESTGVRMPDIMGGTGMGSGNERTRFLRKRESPWASAVFGYAFGSATWHTVSSDFAVFRKGAVMAVSSPGLVSRATGQQVDAEELGGWKLHAEVTGFADAVANTDEEAIDLVRRFLAYLPSHNAEAPPVVPVTPGSGERSAELAPSCRSRARRSMTCARSSRSWPTRAPSSRSRRPSARAS